jgi:histidinol-phosphatase (PHP family)
MTDRQARDLPLDAHLHTDLSPDSSVPIDVYAAAALERGITEIAITDHVDFEPGAPAFAYSTFADRERVVRGAADRWGPQGVQIRFGVELTYDRSWESEIRDHLAHHAYDFTIGSVHDRVDSPYNARRVAAWVEGRPLAEIVAPSFDEVEAAARSGLFDAIGHIDVVKRYLFPYVKPADLEAAPELYERILHALVESGTALEVNTSGLRYAIRQTFPHPAIVARFRELGGRAVTIGSDAHGQDQFAWGLADGYAIATEAGFSELTFRRAPGATRVPVPIPTPPMPRPQRPTPPPQDPGSVAPPHRSRSDR